ncbi:hypothetical protein BJ878DRAFT_413751 [Calycina marina]|uniref:Uncharacterized protein n=1 Tax=Calycina marina TaxID=1763456 RepID=A0A9P8CIJ1_9HELO|nr:hypothetical protein BJ878DRAFT_413751 [Calycina marina]
MPLVDPVTNSAGGDKTAEWQNKLVGKTLGDSHDEVNFAKKDLPKEHRVIEPGSMVTRDFKEDRLNVHVDDKGIVTHVNHG